MAFPTATSAISFAVRREGPLYSDSPTPTIATSPRTSGISQARPQSKLPAR